MFLNSLLMMAELELEGRQAAKLLGLDSGEDLYETLRVLSLLDEFFVAVFLLELLLRTRGGPGKPGTPVWFLFSLEVLVCHFYVS